MADRMPSDHPLTSTPSQGGSRIEDLRTWCGATSGWMLQAPLTGRWIRDASIPLASKTDVLCILDFAGLDEILPVLPAFLAAARAVQKSAVRGTAKRRITANASS